MQYWVGVTDNGWFDFLSREAPDEVNFWQPSGKPPFTQLAPGAPFLFKLKRPYNHIAGGGFFVKFSALPIACSSSFTSSKIFAVRPCFSSRWRKRKIVVSSGTTSSLNSMRTKRRIDSLSYSESSACGSDRLNHCWTK